MKNPKRQWGILACGQIAHAFATAIKEVKGSELLAVSSRTRARAETFAREYGVKSAYGSYEAMLADDRIDAVYIATLHPFHKEWVLKAIEAGKDVLCEKPLTMNFEEASTVLQFAKERNCLLREAFMYRHHPQTRKLVELIASGMIGEVRMVEATFCVNRGLEPESRLQAKALGGGAILDLGCYAMSFARLVAGRARGGLFAEPIDLKAVGHLDPDTGTDMWTTAVLRFEGDILARVSAAMRLEEARQGGVVYGEKGKIYVENAWHCREHIRLELDGKSPRTFPSDTRRPLFCYEIEAFERERAGESLPAEWVGMSALDTLGNMKALDRWRAEIDLRYAADELEG